MPGWERDAHELRRRDGRYFRIFGVEVESDAREVPGWTQPMVQPVETSIAAFVTQPHRGPAALPGAGAHGTGGLEPDRVGTDGAVAAGRPDGRRSGALPPGGSRSPGRAGIVRHRSTQSEEGGRFYRYATENIVVELDPADDRPAPPNYTWVTLGQLNTLIRYGNHLNIEARSVLACLDVQG